MSGGNVSPSRQRLMLSNLSEPQQMRELNRQLEWIWAQLMGGLSKKSLSGSLQTIIDSKAEEKTVDELTGRVTENESQIIQQADLIATKVSKTEYSTALAEAADSISDLESRVTVTESSITQQAGQIESKVSRTEYDSALAQKADTSDVETLGQRVSSAESSITQNADAITTKVSQSDFNALGQRVSSAESSISQTPNQITAAVSALKVGSRNYILGTAAAYPAIGGGSERRWLYPWKCAGIDVLKTLYGKTVTVSFDYNQWVNSGSFQLLINGTWQGVVTLDSSGNGNNKHFEKTFDIKSYDWGTSTEDVPIYIDGTWSGTVLFWNFKMEVGDKATDWTAAPEDGIGGTNLLYCSNDFGAYGSRGFWTDQSGADNKGIGEWQTDGSVLVTNNNSNFRFAQSNIAVTDGDVLTISAEYKDVSGECPHQFQVTIYDSDGNMFYDYANIGSKTNIGGGWVKSSYTFAIPHGGASMIAWFRSGTDYTLYTHSYYIRRPKLERGSVASDWSQNPEEVRIGSSIEMDEYHTEIKTPYLDIDVTGTNGDTHIDENGLSTGTGTFDHVNCPELVRTYAGASTITLSSGGSVAVVSDVLHDCMLSGDVSVTLSGDVSGVLNLHGLCGSGNVTIKGNSHTLNGYILLSNNAVRISIESLTVSKSSDNRQCVKIDRCAEVKLYGCVFNANSTPSNAQGVRSSYSKLFIQACEFYNIPDSAMAFSYGTDALVLSCKGSATYCFYYDGATLRASGTRPYGSCVGGNPSFLLPSDPSTVTVDYGSATPTVTPATTASFTATLTGTGYPSSHFINGDNIIRQGYEGTGSSARADYGCMWFGASALSGKTILSATLTITRIKGKGGSSAVTMTLYTSPLTGKSGDIRSGLVSYGEIGSIANGETLTVSVPTDAIAAVAAGGAFVLYTGETAVASGKTYSRHYAHFEGTDGAAPVLTVTYQ